MVSQTSLSVPILLGFLSLVTLLVFPISSASESSESDVSDLKSLNRNLVQCLSLHSPYSSNITKLVYSPSNSSYSSILESTAQNLRFYTSSTPRPLFIITPFLESHVQAAVICCKRYSLQIKTRSGGHDYEGLSYTSDYQSFVILDLAQMKKIDLNLEDSTAWVQSGNTNGELFYQLYLETKTHGFPAGSYPTVGFGGLLSGGGLGTLLRKYGLSADNVLDARIVNVHGKILDKESMGEDLFWAIRGGGGASFGVLLSWKLRLVPVPEIVSVFTIPKTLEQGGSQLFYKWQSVGPTLPEDIFMRIGIQNVASSSGNRTIQIAFRGFFLGGAAQMFEIMNDRFPELGVRLEDCTEMSYIQSIVYFANYAKQVPIEALINQRPGPKTFLKTKSDFVKEPISEAGLQGLWEKCLQRQSLVLSLDSFGGKMDEISESTLPFPHRRGNLYNILYVTIWNNEVDTQVNLDSVASVYDYMTPYVSKSPRTTYLNIRDLDIGRNTYGRKTNYSEAKIWGEKCFKGNFKRLALVKGRVDPTNFFWNEQSIPPYFGHLEN